jgi:hypothetical protein
MKIGVNYLGLRSGDSGVDIKTEATSEAENARQIHTF